MNTRRFKVIGTAAIATLVSLCAWSDSTAAGSATPPDSSVPASPDAPVSAEDFGPEIVQSWTLTPAGGPDGEEVGTRPNLTYQVAPGAVIEDAVIVYNLGNVPMNFQVYATDAFNNDDGEFDLLPTGEVPVDAGSWVTLAEDGVTLPPGKQATIPVTITVPIDATPGDHVGAIVASNVAVSDNGDGQVVNVDRRTGTRLYLQVDGPLTPELAVVDVETSYHHEMNPLGGSADVTFRVENRGNVRLGGTPSVSVSGPFGLGKQTVTLPPLSELLPGQDVTLTATIEDVPAGMLDITTVRIEPVDPAAFGGVEVAEGSDLTFTPPIALLMVLLALLFGSMAWRRFGRHRRAAAEQAAVAAAGPDAAEPSDLEPQLQ